MALQWLSLVATIWLQAINGTNSNFPAYSSQLKHILSLSQLQLNNLAFASDAGKLLGWLAGAAATRLPLWIVLVTGSILGLVGYGVQYLFLTGQISALSYWHVFFLTVVAGNSVCWINTVCYLISINNFPLDRQISVGLSTSYIGLSGKIYTDLVDVIASPSSSPAEKAKTYLFLNAVMPLLVCALTALVARDVTVSVSKKMERGFGFMLVITAGMGIYAVVSTTVTDDYVVRPWVRASLTGAFFVFTLVVPLMEHVMDRMQKKCWLRSGENRVYDISHTEKQVDMNSSHKSDDNVFEEVNAIQMLRMLDFWLYFVVYLFGATIGLVFLNNLGQITESRGYSRTSYLVSLSSSFGFFGRLLPSLFDFFVTSYGGHTISRPGCIAIFMVPMGGAFFLLLDGTNFSLIVSTAVVGVCSGAITSLAVSTTTELFGSENFAVNHNIVVANIPTGSFLFGGMAALIYRENGVGKEGRCMGMDCYRTTFFIWGCLCLIGTLLALILYARTRKFYSKMLG